MSETLDMNSIVGSHDLVMITLDTLRYDVARERFVRPPLGESIDTWRSLPWPLAKELAAEGMMALRLPVGPTTNGSWLAQQARRPHLPGS